MSYEHVHVAAKLICILVYLSLCVVLDVLERLIATLRISLQGATPTKLQLLLLLEESRKTQNFNNLSNNSTQIGLLIIITIH